MGLGFTRTTPVGGSIPVWQGDPKDFLLVQGGFLLDLTGLTLGTVLKEGTPMTYDEATRLAKPLKTAVAQAVAGGSATTYQVLKGHDLKVGENIAIGAKGGKAYAITIIDTAGSALFDTITVATSIGAAAVGDLIYVSSANGATASAFTAKGLLYSDVKVEAGETCGVVIGNGSVYARRIPYSAALETELKANGVTLHFSQSY